MEEGRVVPAVKILVALVWLTAVALLAMTLGMWTAANSAEREPRVVYPKETKLNFEGMQLEGELRNPGEFYFKIRPQEKFDSLVKRRRNFHREMLRDAVMSR